MFNQLNKYDELNYKNNNINNFKNNNNQIVKIMFNHYGTFCKIYLIIIICNIINIR